MDVDDDIPMSIESADDTPLSAEATDEAPAGPPSPPVPARTCPQEVQRRTFARWPHTSVEFRDRTMQAGFYACNIEDRVICVACKLVCHRWQPRIDDPCDVHRTVSPNCPYVQRNLLNVPERRAPAIPVINPNLSPTVNTAMPPADLPSAPTRLNLEEIVPKACQHPGYEKVYKRADTFTNWDESNSPSIEDLTRAGFFYQGVYRTVTCFYCDVSLQGWTSKNDPVLEHIRVFPRCGYARQLCEREQVAPRQSPAEHSGSNGLTFKPPPKLHDVDVLDRMVAERMSRPSSQLLTIAFSRAIVQRAWRDQLRTRDEDFLSAEDLLIACRVLQTQMEGIGSNRENLIVPSERMSLLARTAAVEARRPQATQDQARSHPVNPCVLCQEEEQQLACLPCGHLAACKLCGHYIRSCPVCQRAIEAFVRVYT